MKLKYSTAYLILICFSVISCISFTQCRTKDALLEDILNEHAKAMGTKDKWKALGSYEMNFKRANNSILNLYCTMPDKLEYEFINDSIELHKVYDGKNGYITRNGKYEKMRPGELIEMREEPHYFSELLFAKDSSYTLEYLGKERIDSLDCHKILLIKSESDHQSYWLHPDSYLIYQTGEYSEDKAHAGIYYKTKLEDYRLVDGLMFPFKQSLIPNDGEARVSYCNSIKINTKELDERSYEPDFKDLTDLIEYWKDSHDNELKSFSFIQETIQFKEDGSSDTSTWNELIEYPDKFRIDFGDTSLHNSNLYRNDSIYVLRNNTIVHQGPKIQEFLLIEGALYHLETDTTLERLAKLGFDSSLFRTSNYKDRKTYVIGAETGDSLSSQIWIDAKRRSISKMIMKTPKDQTMLVKFTEYAQVEGFEIECFLEFYLDGILVQTEKYNSLKANPDFDTNVFHPIHFNSSYWY